MMDFERLKANLRMRSGRTPRNQSKKFPTRPLEKSEPPWEDNHKQQDIVGDSRPAPRPGTKPETMAGHQERPPQPRKQKASASVQSSGPNPRNYLQEEEMTAMPDPKPSESDSGEADYDLRPAVSPAKPMSTSIEELSELLFSKEYLDHLINDPQVLSRFTIFLSKYKPSIAHLVLQYVQAQKVIKAISYANAVASTLKESPSSPVPPEAAAKLSPSFQETSDKAFNALLSEALPAWVTYSLVKTSTSCLTSEMTNQSSPLTRDLVGGLSEVFCITDPKQEDNPIVYASDEFYRLTGYGKDNVIGYNCRFLQGRKTKRDSVERLKTAVKNGEEISETLLNYRRDGRPFVNILMLAPLHDGKGNVKYYLGAQVDASRLVDNGRGVDGFERFLTKREMGMLEMDGNRARKEKGEDKEDSKQNVLGKLRQLSMAFDLEESAVVQSSSRGDSLTRDGDEEGKTDRDRQTPRARRRLEEGGEEDDDENSHSDEDKEEADQAWKISSTTPSGKLPGIYKKYLLIRPYPSLKIIFVSQSARRLAKLQQRPFLAYIAAPSSTINGLKDSFATNTPVTAKVSILPEVSKNREGTVTGRWGSKSGDAPDAKGRSTTCWISATPLADNEKRVGVWMVVIVDSRSMGANMGRLAGGLKGRGDRDTMAREEKERAQGGELPIKPKVVGDVEALENGIDGGEEPKESHHLDSSTQQSQRQESPEEQNFPDAIHAQQQGAGIPSTPSPLPNNEDKENGGEEEDEDENENGTIAPDNTPRQQRYNQPNNSNNIEDSPQPASARDVGLRATNTVDYLTSRSPLNKRGQRQGQGQGHGQGQVNGFGASNGDHHEEEEEEEENTIIDWSAASPYSVD